MYYSFCLFVCVLFGLFLFPCLSCVYEDSRTGSKSRLNSVTFLAYELDNIHNDQFDAFVTCIASLTL